jgi:non-canonical (house-cleaning) NTP pyrophosphatase
MNKCYIASTSTIKLKAVRNALIAVKLDHKYEIVGTPVNSGVPEQPMNDETRIGAKNRLTNLKTIIEKSFNKKNDIVISLENGIYYIGGLKYIDVCYCIVYHNNKTFTTESKGIKVPSSIVEESKETGDTCGSIIEKKYNYNKDSWHEHFSYDGHTRDEIIAECLAPILKEIQMYIQ